MKNLNFALLATGCVLASTGTANADIIRANASLDASQEVGTGSTSTATGVGVLEYDTDTGAYTFSLSVDGFDLADSTFPDAPLAFGAAGPVHIHEAAAGANGPIVLPFPDLADYDDTPVSGFNVSASGDLASDASISVSDFLAALNAEGTYINVHSLSFPGGAIRGQLLVEVAEPASLALLGLGLAGLVSVRRRT